MPPNVFDESVVIQPSIKIIPLGFGASSVVYEVNSEIVLKAPVILERPPDTETRVVKNNFYITTQTSYRDLENERFVYRQLSVHPNIVTVLAMEHKEGIYLQRHRPLSQRIAEAAPSNTLKNAWYLGMVRALNHLHTVGIAHADVRIGNFLCDANDNILLCDFGLSCRFGSGVPTTDDLYRGTLNVNGRFETVSAASDRFALASVIFELEMGEKLKLADVEGNHIRLPVLRTSSQQLDGIIYSAWENKFSSTFDMLKGIESMQEELPISANVLTYYGSGMDKQRQLIKEWRNMRIEKYGKFTLPSDISHKLIHILL